jgi:hypothetical protein
MTMKTGIAVALAVVAAVGGAAGAASAATGQVGAATAHASARQLTFLLQPTDLKFFSNTGPISGFPTSPLVPGDRVIGQDRILRGGKVAGHDDEVCTIAFGRDAVCQDMVILGGLGDIQVSWTFQWPASGNRGPASFTGVIDGGTGRFRTAHGTYRADALPDGDLRITATMTGDD